MAFQGRKLAHTYVYVSYTYVYVPYTQDNFLEWRSKAANWLDLFIGTLCFSPLKSVLAHQFAFFRYVICALNVLYKAETGYSLVFQNSFSPLKSVLAHQFPFFPCMKYMASISLFSIYEIYGKNVWK